MNKSILPLPNKQLTIVNWDDYYSAIRGRKYSVIINSEMLSNSGYIVAKNGVLVKFDKEYVKLWIKHNLRNVVNNQKFLDLLEECKDEI